MNGIDKICSLEESVDYREPLRTEQIPVEKELGQGPDRPNISDWTHMPPQLLLLDLANTAAHARLLIIDERKDSEPGQTARRA
jgi:hypothetical protein